MRVRRRRRSPVVGWIATTLVVLVAAGLTWWLLWSGGPLDLTTEESGPPVVAPGGFRAAAADDHTITVGLEVRNTTADPVTLVGAEIVPPAGLTQVSLALLAPGQSLTLDGDLPALAPVVLGTEPQQRNGFLAARFAVDCDNLATGDGPTGERITVTIDSAAGPVSVDLTPPVVAGVAWLTATANRACSGPVMEGSPGAPLPPLPA
jgi:hypothetical protein